jgi:predicted SAM-dependent methyltransferase
MNMHRRSLRKAQRISSQGLRLNCGCGPVIKQGWINIDLFAPTADLHLDLRRPLPFHDGVAAIIYSEHFFEHLEYPLETGAFLTESLRVLQRGGLFRVGVPDTEWPIIAYATGDERYFRLAQERWHPSWCDTRMHNINYHFRQGIEHKYAYDYETLAKVLIQAGFSSVTRSEFDPASDSESRRVGTLYVEARK